MKQSVYIETSVISYLTSRPSRDLVVAAHQQVTAAWWEERAADYELFVSELVIEEMGRGYAAASARRVAAIAGLPVLDVSEQAFRLAERLISQGPMPALATADATHVAIAACTGMDFLVTWNCRHLANPVLRNDFDEVIEDSGYSPPIICTPEQLMDGLP